MGASRARPSSDGGQLLPGEHLESTDPEDVAHWVAVYSELVDVVRGHPDQAAFNETIERYQGRLSFWRARLRRLQGGELRPPD